MAATAIDLQPYASLNDEDCDRRIIKTITAAEPDTQWLVGTELNLVNRLHQTLAGENKTVQLMSPTMHESRCNACSRSKDW